MAIGIPNLLLIANLEIIRPGGADACCGLKFRKR
jgi:hypothetical protein